MRGSVKLWLAGAALLSQSVAYGLGLGGIEVRSGLNEPLEAEISLVAAPGETAGMVVTMASAEEFARVGIDRGRLGIPLEFSVGRNDRGAEVIRVTSSQPIREPFLSFLIDVNWPAGRLLREYTVLLDPPVMAPAVRGSGVSSAPVRDTAAAAPRELDPPDTTSTPVADAPRRSSSADTPSTTRAPVTGEYGPVASGETLWEIARETRPDSDISINQMMITLLQANPDAFVNGNINALRRGAILRIPSAEEARALSQAQAIAEVRNQNQAWSGRTATSPTLFADAGTAPISRPGAETAARDDARLELVPPRGDRDSGAGSGANAREAELTAEVARVREELASSQQESRELRSRVRELESLRDNQERMISIKSEELEAIQAQLRQAREEVEALAAAGVNVDAMMADLDSAEEQMAESASQLAADDDLWGASDTDSDAVDAEDTADTADTAMDFSDDEALLADADDSAAASDEFSFADGDTADSATDESLSSTAVPLPEPEVQVATTPVETAPQRPLVSPAAIAPPAAKPFYLQTWFLGAIALLVVVLGVLGISRARGKSAPAGGGSLASRVAGGTAGSAGSADSMADEDEARLLAEIDADPENAELRLELLSIYYARGDKERFEGAAEAMYAQIADPGQDEWQEAVRMGKELCPDNDLFISSDELGMPRDDSEYSVDSLADRAQDTFGEEFAQADDNADDDLFDLDASFDEDDLRAAPVTPDDADTRKREAVGKRDAESVADSTDLDFDAGLEMDLGDDSTSAPNAADNDLGTDLDFDLDFDSEPEPAVDNRTQPMPALDFPEPTQDEVALDLSEPEPEPEELMPEADLDLGEDFFGGEDAVGTKLDLAKAYLDMGDPEGARSMLEEVIAEGSEGQRREAERLIGEI